MESASYHGGSSPDQLWGSHVKRWFDVVCTLCLLTLTAPLLLLIAAAVRYTSRGPVLFRTQRVGRDNKLFTMLKFRTMYMDTPQVATHLLGNPERHLTPIGGFLRKTSLDELPQLINVLRGEMSLVGPRPALFNQHDLVQLRTEQGVHRLTPGITGWAQINGRDDLSVPDKVRLDAQYACRRSLFLDIRIMFSTIVRVLLGSQVSH